jgi:hypothetical protein
MYYRKLVGLLIGLIVETLFLSLLNPANGLAATSMVDFSHDKCVAKNSPLVAPGLGYYSRAIIGVNGGGDWEINPCLKDELQHAHSYALYVNTNYQSNQCNPHLSRRTAFNCGWDLGRWDVSYAGSQGAYSNTWFIDVETGPSIPWQEDDSLNATFLYGLAIGLQSAGVKVIGYYSTQDMWQYIVGSWHSNNYGWYATGSQGPPSPSTIRTDCSTEFTGARNIYYQYIMGDLDVDAPC